MAATRSRRRPVRTSSGGFWRTGPPACLGCPQRFAICSTTRAFACLRRHACLYGAGMCTAAPATAILRATTSRPLPAVASAAKTQRRRAELFSFCQPCLSTSVFQALPAAQVSGETLAYGSADAGTTVLCSNTRLNELMAEAAAALNIKAHRVGPRHAPVTLHSAVDLEGHCGLDGRCYVLDSARAFPPEQPCDGVARRALPRSWDIFKLPPKLE